MSGSPSTGTFVRVWAWLMGLALASFALSFAHLGAWSTVIAIAIGLAKAVLIGAFFMHLSGQPSISRWAFSFGIALMLLLLVMIGVDVTTRESTGLRQPRLSDAASMPDRPPR